jgi:HAMP domain-containing protein
LAALIANLRTTVVNGVSGPEPFLGQIEASLAAARAQSDRLLNIDHPLRAYDAFRAVMPKMLGPSAILGPQLGRAAADAIKIEPELTGMIAVARIGLELREMLGGIEAIALPRLDAGEKLTEADVSQMRADLIAVDAATRLLEVTFYLATPSNEMRALLASAKATRAGIVQRQVDRMIDASGRGDRQFEWSSRPMEIWADQINAIRNVIIQKTVDQAQIGQTTRDQRLYLALAAVAAVVLMILPALAMLQWRVVGPLAQLGFAITRIADGDRGTKLEIKSGTREIGAMVKAVETLRQAALVANETVMRQRDAVRRRQAMLREVLGILESVYEPSHSLERDIARLLEDIEATIALVDGTLPPTLGAAAAAVRLGLREMRDLAPDFKVSTAAANEAETDVLPEAEIVALTAAVVMLIDRRDALVRTIIQPCLLALRDTSKLASAPQAQPLRNLIGDQFSLIEATVAKLASTSAAVTRAAAMVRELPPEVTPMAA